ncbi:hypothetical protein [Novosphingobium huizhouense]|uniref:hypothetical protein n=1 Tax=Novosphingobium huizhouense TaxID=2866625 RepID=UPI001CD892FD|nr:hypothetical protein [Novosphingobium huizhouense]
MNAYNPLAAAQPLEAAGLPRKQAEAIAGEITDGTNGLVTQEQLVAALDKQTIKIGIMMSAIIALACSIMGVLISLK